MWTARMAIAGLVALSAACGAARRSASTPSPKHDTTQAASAEAGPSRVRVEIDNQNVSDMDVYLVKQGTRVPLGWAPGLSKTTLLLPAGSLSASGQVRLLADPIGSARSIRTPTLIVAPGENVYWTIGTDPANSFASAG